MNLESQSELYETSSIIKNGQIINLYEQVSKDGLKKFKARNSWQKRVYKKKENILSDNADLYEYHLLCKAIFKRDGNSCKACFKTRRKIILEKKFLTMHHIQPREEGGSSEVDNLITLCNECHDRIEELKLKTREEIYGYFTSDKKHWSREENIGTKWQQWVYGGYQKPTRNNPK